MKKATFSSGIFSLIAITLAGFWISSCKKDEVESASTDKGYNYYPVQNGATWIYRVDSIVYDDFVSGNPADTIRYWVKHVISDTFTDGIGSLNQKISRYIKSDSNSTFKFNAYFTVRKQKDQLEVEDSSGRYVKLVFPALLQRTWNGNTYNIQSPEYYEIISAPSKEQIGSVFYDSTLHVLHHNVKYLVQESYQIEKFARNTGLIYKRDKYLDITIRDTVKTQKGHDCTYNLEEYIP